MSPSILGFGRRYLCDQVEGSLCMNFQPFRLSPRELSIQAHWSVPPLEASWHGRSSLIDLQNVLRTSCIFPHLTREFLQKHDTPKCTSNGELVISLVCLVAG
jgi:hypothetical protein